MERVDQRAAQPPTARRLEHAVRGRLLAADLDPLGALGERDRARALERRVAELERALTHYEDAERRARDDRQALIELRRRERPRVAHAPVELTVVEDRGHDEPLCQASYVLEAPHSQLLALDLFLRQVAFAGEIGSTRFYRMMVDGDGRAKLRVERDGEPVELTEAEESWLDGDGDPPAELAGLYVERNGEFIDFEIV